MPIANASSKDKNAGDDDEKLDLYCSTVVINDDDETKDRGKGTEAEGAEAEGAEAEAGGV